MVSPAQRRKAANYLVRRFKVSERRACRVVGQHRSTQRYDAVVPELEAQLVVAMNELATKHPRWGYRTVAKLLRDQGWPVNVKRVERLWRQEGHRLPPSKLKESGQKALGVGANSSQNRPAERTNHVWTYDFVSARVRRGGAIRILNVLDEFTRVSLGSSGWPSEVSKQSSSRRHHQRRTRSSNALTAPCAEISSTSKSFTASPKPRSSSISSTTNTTTFGRTVRCA